MSKPSTKNTIRERADSFESISSAGSSLGFNKIELKQKLEEMSKAITSYKNCMQQ